MADDTFARYRAVLLRLWHDEDFRKLSDDAKLTWCHLFTNPLNFSGLGIYKAPLVGLADELGWELGRYKAACGELRKKFILYDDDARLIYFPKYHQHPPNHPRSPNVLKHWGRWWRELPASPLKDKCREDIRTMLEEFDFDHAYLKVFQEYFAGRTKELLPAGSLYALTPPDTRPKAGGLERVKQATEIIQFLNETAGRHYDLTNGHGKPSHSVNLVVARLEEGATPEVCRAVIVRQWKLWKGDKEKEEWMRPATIFGPQKFEQYAGKVPKEAAK